VPHRRPNVFIRLLQHLPGWAWWAGGAIIVAVYVFFFYYFFVSPFGFRFRALYGDISYPEGYEIHGIDISHHQGKINWQQLKDEGVIDKFPVRFIMIKATEGATRVDENFIENFYQAREYGFTRGAYHFYSVHSPAKDQAEFFIRNVELENGDLPPVLDVEYKPEKQSDEDFQKSVLQWLQIVEQHYGVKPIIYTYYKFKMKYLDDAAFDPYPYWIAHYYVEEVEYKGPWKFWQHTDVGRLPGIKGYVDFNIYNGSYYDLRKMTIGARELIGDDAYTD
jgi:lysozyme